MKPERTSTGLLLIFVLACAGAVLVVVPSWIAGHVDTISRIGPRWLLYAYIAAVGLGGLLLAVATGTILWKLWGRTLLKRRRAVERNKNPSQLSRQEQEQEIADNLMAVHDLQNELSPEDALREQLEPLAEQIEAKREAQTLELVAFGAISSGKSSLLNALAGRDVFRTDAKGGTTIQRNQIPWPGADRVQLVDTPGLGEVDGAERGRQAASAAKDADLVLLVIDGPLRSWEFELLRRLSEMEKRVLVCLNKEDWYRREELDALLGQIREQVKHEVAAEDLVAVRAEATTRRRVRVLPDGTQAEDEVEVPPEISALAARMMQIVQRDGRELLLANLLLQSRGLVEEARTRVQDALDRRAWALVDKYAWGAGGAAALSVFPILDLVAGCAISTKMVVDLGRVYRQDVDLDTAITLLGQLGKNLIGILGVSAATPAVTAAVASLVKVVPGAGTIAGGMLQGVVQALITRWIGAVFIAYFKNGMQASEGGLAGIARREWDRMTTVDELRRLVQTARRKMDDERPST